tara:strand:- start:273 stop:569 length:297 start_codon:yes stop_codon:yes gene_type:complete
MLKQVLGLISSLRAISTARSGTDDSLKNLKIRIALTTGLTVTGVVLDVFAVISLVIFEAIAKHSFGKVYVTSIILYQEYDFDITFPRLNKVEACNRQK